VQVLYDEGVANHIGPKPCAGVREDVGRGTGRPAIEPRQKTNPGRRRCLCSGRRHVQTRQRERLDGPAWS
jgi:hypothetical protein